MMSHDEVKNEFLDYLKNDLKISVDIDKIPKIHLMIIDEAVESILLGKHSINGNPPKTKEERIICIGYYFKIADQSLKSMIDIAQKIYPDANINLTYRGEPFKY